MCYQKFDAEHIETHAAECQGEVEGKGHIKLHQPSVYSCIILIL